MTDLRWRSNAASLQTAPALPPDQWPEGRKPLARRPILRFLLLWRVAASPHRQKLIPTCYLPHRLLVTKSRISFAMARACAASFSQVAVFSNASPFSIDLLAAPRPSRESQ